MKAAVLTEVGGSFDVLDIGIDNPEAHEVLIDVKASGLCHSDLHVASSHVGFPMPAVLGHEVSGLVVGVGSAVTSVQIGDRVVTSPVHSCGTCKGCRTGKPYQCRVPSHTDRGAERDPRLSLDGQRLTQFIGVGGFAEQVLVHENTVIKVPDAIPFDRAALLGCGVVTGAGAAINTARIRPGDTVAVIGAGGVGLNVIQGAKLAGATRIIAIDLQPAKLELAEIFGATDVINGAEGDALEAVKQLTGGVTHAFEVIGLQATSEQAVAMLEIGGTAYLIGVHKPGAQINLTPFGDLMGRQKGIRGVAMGSSNIQVDIPMYAELYLQGRFKLDELVSAHISLDEIGKGYEQLRGGAVARSVITF